MQGLLHYVINLIWLDIMLVTYFEEGNNVLFIYLSEISDIYIVKWRCVLDQVRS